MMLIRLQERGATPRRLKKVFREGAKKGFYNAGKYFHAELRDLRFTNAHGRAAGYAPRRGENMSPSQKGFKSTYTYRKWKKYHHRNPLQLTKETRDAVRSANISSTSKSMRVAYPGARKLNWRSPGSKTKPSEEFKRLLPAEVVMMAKQVDKHLDFALRWEGR